MNYPSNQSSKEKTSVVLRRIVDSESMSARLEEVLKEKKTAFVSSLIQLVSTEKGFENVNPQSILSAAMTAATLDLPINKNLGFAYVIPYGKEAQFQIGYKGFIQLAQRSGQFKTLNAVPVYDSDTDADVMERLTSLIPRNPVGKVVGYVAYFELLNGFKASLPMTIEQLEEHAKQYSQSYKKGYGQWKDNFSAMALKTVFKLLLSKQAPLSVDMQTAIEKDQSVIIDNETVSYVDNGGTPPAVNQIVVDDGLFENLIESISTGEMTVDDALNNPSYAFTPEQIEQINAL